jgi:hypothetical protein
MTNELDILSISKVIITSRYGAPYFQALREKINMMHDQAKLTEIALDIIKDNRQQLFDLIPNIMQQISDENKAKIINFIIEKRTNLLYPEVKKIAPAITDDQIKTGLIRLIMHQDINELKSTAQDIAKNLKAPELRLDFILSIINQEQINYYDTMREIALSISDEKLLELIAQSIMKKHVDDLFDLANNILVKITEPSIQLSLIRLAIEKSINGVIAQTIKKIIQNTTDLKMIEAFIKLIVDQKAYEFIDDAKIMIAQIRDNNLKNQLTKKLENMRISSAQQSTSIGFMQEDID